MRKFHYARKTYPINTGQNTNRKGQTLRNSSRIRGSIFHRHVFSAAFLRVGNLSSPYVAGLHQKNHRLFYKKKTKTNVIGLLYVPRMVLSENVKFMIFLRGPSESSLLYLRGFQFVADVFLMASM